MCRVVFGLNGRTKEEIREAVRCGYKIFDGGDTYEGTAGDLVSVLKETGKAVQDYQLLYKLDRDYESGQLEDHLRELAGNFGGKLYCAMAHHWETAERYREILFHLKEDGIIQQAGIGGTLEDDRYDCCELNIEEMLTEEWMLGEAQPAVLFGENKTIYFFNIFSTAKKIVQYSNGKEEDFFLTARYLMARVSSRLGNRDVVPIMSSSRPDVMRRNLQMNYESVSEELTSEQYQMLENSLTNYIAARSRLPRLQTMKEEEREKIRKNLGRHDWSGASEAEASFFEDNNARNNEKKEVLAGFQEAVRKQWYQTEKGIYTFQEIIEMLYAPDNCSRVRAFEILCEAL